MQQSCAQSHDTPTVPEPQTRRPLPLVRARCLQLTGADLQTHHLYQVTSATQRQHVPPSHDSFMFTGWRTGCPPKCRLTSTTHKQHTRCASRDQGYNRTTQIKRRPTPAAKTPASNWRIPTDVRSETDGLKKNHTIQEPAV